MKNHRPADAQEECAFEKSTAGRGLRYKNMTKPHQWASDPEYRERVNSHLCQLAVEWIEIDHAIMSIDYFDDKKISSLIDLALPIDHEIQVILSEHNLYIRT